MKCSTLLYCCVSIAVLLPGCQSETQTPNASSDVTPHEPGDTNEVTTLSDKIMSASHWNEKLTHSRELAEALRYGEAVELLSALLERRDELQGPNADMLLSMTHGTLGMCLFDSGEPTRAIQPTKTALNICEKAGDVEGIIAYLTSMFEIHRYLGQKEKTASVAERIAEVFAANDITLVVGDRRTDASYWRDQAERVLAGEPLNRVVAHTEDGVFELDELPHIDIRQRVQLAFERNRPNLRLATELTDQAKQLGRARQYDKALSLCRRAAAVDPFDPDPRYQEAVYLMNMERYAEAAEAYHATEALACGWFYCRSDMWIAEQLAMGSGCTSAFAPTPNGGKSSIDLFQVFALR